MAESRPVVISETAAPPLLLHVAERVHPNAELLPIVAFVGARCLPSPHDRAVAFA